MANFKKAYELVAIHEGGYQRNPKDRGNYNSNRQLVGTNWGIAAFVYEKWVGHPPSTSEMRSMKKETTAAIFKKYFWDRIQGDHLQSQAVANILYDGAVNHGVRQATKFAQRVVGVNDDGILGPITLEAINEAQAASVYRGIRDLRLVFYVKLALRKKSQLIFLKGWVRRILSFKDY